MVSYLSHLQHLWFINCFIYKLFSHDCCRFILLKTTTFPLHTDWSLLTDSISALLFTIQLVECPPTLGHFISLKKMPGDDRVTTEPWGNQASIFHQHILEPVTLNLHVKKQLALSRGSHFFPVSSIQGTTGDRRKYCST